MNMGIVSKHWEDKMAERPSTFSIDMTGIDLEVLDKAMNELHGATVNYIKKLAVELGVSDDCAADVYYLRGRSRWTQKLEDDLIALHSAGTPPSIFDFGHGDN